MNLPNKITVSRMILIPIFMIFMLADLPMGTFVILGTEIPVGHFIAACIFIFASATDWLDGYYARKLNLVTNFGKFLDPLADKLLVTAALIGLVQLDLLAGWMAIVIISREFAVTGIRLIAAGEGDVIAASPIAKWKTTFQIIGISALMLYNIPFAALSFPFADIMMWIATILTIVSGVDYFVKNKHVLANQG
ncbi:CDP-diacylglycerol--glycerol-3-phosphate 3-phosphatidyltransferase [Alkalihalobacillus pseudalcaliphilus]|uniref:CDP-diacylglycerol--glycerol-3-phosphate 3-phosphatidyltransferase n=1 Tax=Alkalihalobacillus pseudalcaliphilus TaxID=79884 RepID=UPI00064DAAD2|nr:CDP-diacylglycerol--glycerol-3-phosphate 3-phosphatidyltransferase [Alkalihalobacillus pseudalcaliphilus]KMK77282.1 CDP-diacylglycerol--glycerol-3-phosphate 3-phosphatidyltransferase [Alkalihalobacillus pseudalcaliphilus]